VKEQKTTHRHHRRWWKAALDRKRLHEGILAIK
jgi:hypothetical protein